MGYKKISGIWISPLFLLAFWKIVSHFGSREIQLLPPPESVFSSLILLLSSGELLKHLAVSLVRVALGFSLAALVGIGIGLALGWFRKVRELVDPLIEIFRPIPPMAWIPLAILWFGIGEISKVYIIFYGAFFPIVINTAWGVRNINPHLIRMARSLNLKRWLLFREVIFPGSLPAVVTGLRIGLGVGWMCLVTAELIAADSGIGYLIEESKELLRVDRVILGMVMIGVMGIVSDQAIRFLERRISGRY